MATIGVRPGDVLATHEVVNQPPPLQGRNLFTDHVALVEALEREGGGWARGQAEAVGAAWGGEPIEWGRLAWALLAEPVDPAVEAERLEFRHAYRDVIAAVLAEGIEAGELPPQDPGTTAAALVGAIGEALVGPLSPTGASTDADRLVGDLVTFCLRSVTVREETHVHVVD